MTSPDRQTQAEALRALLARLRLGVAGAVSAGGQGPGEQPEQAAELAALPDLIDSLESLLLTQLVTARADAAEGPSARALLPVDAVPAGSHAIADAEDLERLVFERTLALEALREEHRASIRQQEQTASRQAATIERLRHQLDQLAAGKDEPAGRSGQQRHHQRFARLRAPPQVEDALDPSYTPNPAEQTMDAPLFTRANFQPRFEVREDGAYDVTDFLALHDRSFVRAAYLAILRREPDPQGAENYVGLVRAGHPKARLLQEFLQSEEGRRHITRIRGLQTHLRVLRWCELPVIGRFVSAMLFLANVNGHLRDLRVLENHVVRIAEESQAVSETNLGKLRSLGR